MRRQAGEIRHSSAATNGRAWRAARCAVAVRMAEKVTQVACKADVPACRGFRVNWSWLWLGVSNRGPVSAKGIYEMIKRRGRQAGVHVYPHRFRHHFSHTWLDRGGPEGDLRELNGWVFPRMLPGTVPVPALPGPGVPMTASWTASPDHGRASMTPGPAAERRI
jgi:integrase